MKPNKAAILLNKIKKIGNIIHIKVNKILLCDINEKSTILVDYVCFIYTKSKRNLGNIIYKFYVMTLTHSCLDIFLINDVRT